MNNTDHHSEEVTVTMTMSRDELLAAMQANKPAPRPLTTTEQSAAAGSKFARPNIAQQQAAVEPQPQAATDKQYGFIARLAKSHVMTDAQRTKLEGRLAAKDMSKKVASATIDWLQGLPVAPAPQAPVAAPSAPQSAPDAWKRPDCVPDGQYALRGDDGVIRFYTVNTNDGICWVAIHASDDRHNIKGRARHQVLDAIAADPRAAAVLFGHETNHCGRCGKELTKKESREAGIGPICAQKVGWA